MYENSKIGRKSEPLFIMLLVFITGGIFGFFWLALKMKDLRFYRCRGLSGWVVLSLIPINILSIIAIASTVWLEIFIVPILSLIFLLFISYRMPFVIEKELAKLGSAKSKWFEIGSLQVVAVTITFLGVYIKFMYDYIDVPEYFGYGYYLVIPGLILNSLWYYFIQRKLNKLWKVAYMSRPFAEPEMSIDAASRVNEIEDRSDAKSR